MMHCKPTTLLFACFVCLPLFIAAQGTNQIINSACPKLAARDSTSKINDLRPTDIKIMLAMGDSITAGFGLEASGKDSTWYESRGLSFSIGGDEGAITLPNLFERYVPQVTGFSVGTTDAQVCVGNNCPAQGYDSDLDGTNAAQSGALVIDMVSSQIDYLIRQVNQRPDMDVLKDWKVLTIMVGVDDICASCTSSFNNSFLSPDDYESNLMGTLERIRSSLPRTFVNLIPIPNVSQAYDLSLKAPQCRNVTRKLFVSCDCLYDPAAEALRRQVDGLLTQFTDRATKIATYYQRKAYDDFAVVVHPFLTRTRIADLPTSFLSSVDCFHPSQTAHKAMAIALWNSMLTPSASKATQLSMDDAVICPNEDTLLYTF